MINLPVICIMSLCLQISVSDNKFANNLHHLSLSVSISLYVYKIPRSCFCLGFVVFPRRMLQVVCFLLFLLFSYGLFGYLLVLSFGKFNLQNVQGLKHSGKNFTSIGWIIHSRCYLLEALEEITLLVKRLSMFLCVDFTCPIMYFIKHVEFRWPYDVLCKDILGICIL